MSLYIFISLVGQICRFTLTRSCFTLTLFNPNFVEFIFLTHILTKFFRLNFGFKRKLLSFPGSFVCSLFIVYGLNNLSLKFWLKKFWVKPFGHPFMIRSVEQDIFSKYGLNNLT